MKRATPPISPLLYFLLVLVLTGCPLGLLLVSGPAEAYVRSATDAGIPMRWPNRPVLNVELYTASPPEYLDRDTLVEAVSAAAATWSWPNVGCTGLEVTIAPVDDQNAPVAYDSVNRITFRKEEWKKFPCDPEKEEICGLYDPGAIALTSVFALKSNGRILDSDMELNAVNFLWADVIRDGSSLPDLDRQLHDLQNVVTHEIGHLVGLDHNCYDPAANRRGRPNDHLGSPVGNCEGAPASIRAATMYNSASKRDVSKRDLTADDIQAVCDVYPFGSGPEEVSGGCAVAGNLLPGPSRRKPGGVPLLTAVGLGAALGLRRRRWRR